MDTKTRQDVISAALITKPTDEPEYVADLFKMLHQKTEFDIAVLGCELKSFLSTRFDVIFFPADKFTTRSNAKIKTHCRLIEGILEDDLPEGDRVEINNISGQLQKITHKLKSIFDLCIIPRSLKIPYVSKLAFRRIGLQLAKIEKIPVLFCPKPERWQRVVIMEVCGDRDYGELSTINFLIKFLGNAIQQDIPGDIPSISIHSINSAKHSSFLESFGIVDASKMQPEQQANTVIVVSTKILGSLLLYSKLKQILRNWSGGILIFPS